MKKNNLFPILFKLTFIFYSIYFFAFMPLLIIFSDSDPIINEIIYFPFQIFLVGAFLYLLLSSISVTKIGSKIIDKFKKQ